MNMDWIWQHTTTIWIHTKIHGQITIDYMMYHDVKYAIPATKTYIYIYIGPQNRTFLGWKGVFQPPIHPNTARGQVDSALLKWKVIDSLVMVFSLIGFSPARGDFLLRRHLLWDAASSRALKFAFVSSKTWAVACSSSQKYTKNTILLVAFGNVRVFQRDSSLEMLRISMIYLWSESQYSTLRCCSYPSSTVCHLHNRALLESRWSSGWCIQKPWASRISRPLDVLLIESVCCAYTILNQPRLSFILPCPQWTLCGKPYIIRNHQRQFRRNLSTWHERNIMFLEMLDTICGFIRCNDCIKMLKVIEVEEE